MSILKAALKLVMDPPAGLKGKPAAGERVGAGRVGCWNGMRWRWHESGICLPP